MNFDKKYLDLVRELEQMPEHQRLERIRRFGISIETFQGNFRELVHHLEIHNNPKLSLKLMEHDKRPILHAYRIEITRFLHNYIAASLSLIDNARVHYKELYGEDIQFPDYQEQIDKRFTQEPLSVFVKDLRQYIQHYQMLELSSRLSKSEDALGIETTIRITTKDLMRFSGWKEKSRLFIAKSGNDIDLMKLARDYYEHINNFYHWFIKRQVEIHKKDIEIVQAHMEKIRGKEMVRSISELIAMPKTIEEFEKDLAEIFHEKELGNLKNRSSKAEMIAHVLESLNKKQV